MAEFVNRNVILVGNVGGNAGALEQGLQLTQTRFHVAVVAEPFGKNVGMLFFICDQRRRFVYGAWPLSVSIWSVS